MVPKNNPVQQNWKMFITKPSTLIFVIFWDLVAFSVYLDIKGGLKRVKYSFYRKSHEEQSCLFYWNLQNHVSYVKIGPQIKKLVFLDLVVFAAFLQP